ncbi:MAG: class I SAM-dependent methyltransferase [Gammaproteobacteria bacterium]|nr:MAG: class I SAM-dependent methyltransferase [Gammaproteobacteria bacterium]
MNDLDPTLAESHFAFGRNWSEYARKITEAEIEEAEKGLLRLFERDQINGARFLDIGSGSGLHCLAALRLGASEVAAIDIDNDSVETTRAVLERYAPGKKWLAERVSVLEFSPDRMGLFDVVYSWGVLHHTGNMYRAIKRAASVVNTNGLFAFALYRRIWMDPFWRYEKKWYAHATSDAQARARGVYVALFRLGLLFTGRRYADYVQDYRNNRGMDFYHDVHDWMGGWPYESITADEVEGMMQELGFRSEKVFSRHGRILGRDLGIFSSGCDEYVYRRMDKA